MSAHRIIFLRKWRKLSCLFVSTILRFVCDREGISCKSRLRSLCLLIQPLQHYYKSLPDTELLVNPQQYLQQHPPDLGMTILVGSNHHQQAHQPLLITRLTTITRQY